MRIAECAGCKALCESLKQNQVLIFNWLYDVAADHHMPAGWHRQLAEKIASRDPDAAEAAMREHVRYAIEDIQREIVRRFGTLTNGLEGVHRSGGATVMQTGRWRTKVPVTR
jgi:DNA-binding GntR family transcriptional regulator